ncbi:MAG: hypothetical protein KAI72_01955 [Candidatus Pacebacteria bacterium]|nr:hypothetical protein [Candidatus Paceibacterota bacterium]
MFLGKNKARHYNNDGFMWKVYIITAIIITFFVGLEIFREKSDVFSLELEPTNVTASVANTEMVDVSVKIIPTD